jgi:hypothetical protein
MVRPSRIGAGWGPVPGQVGRRAPAAAPCSGAGARPRSGRFIKTDVMTRDRFLMALLVAALLILAARPFTTIGTVRSKTCLQTLRQRQTSQRVPDLSVHLKAFGMTGSATYAWLS